MGKKRKKTSFDPIFDLLVTVAQGLKNQTLLFGFGMGVLVVFALIVSGTTGNNNYLYFTIIALILIVTISLFADYAVRDIQNDENTQVILTDKLEDTSSPQKITEDYMDQFEMLRSWLNKLVDNEFKDMINSLLTTEEILTLPLPLTLIDRGTFLGQMRIYNRLGDVEKYLHKKYPKRFVK